jgi:hypothetical protein
MIHLPFSTTNRGIPGISDALHLAHLLQAAPSETEKGVKKNKKMVRSLA